MVSWLGRPPHYFDSDEHTRQHHFPRAYLRNADYNHEVCTTLYNKSPVIMQDFPLLFGTSRSEMFREQAIELWRTGMPIAPVRTGAKSYAWHHLACPKTPPKNELLGSGHLQNCVKINRKLEKWCEGLQNSTDTAKE